MTPAIRDAYRFCQAYTRRRARNFYLAFAVLPPPKRRAIYAAYAFSGHCDDVADEEGPADEKRRRLADYRQRLRDCYQSRRPDHLFLALGDAIDRYAIPRDYFEALLDGIEMDVSITRYATFDELHHYCYRVASVVGLVCVSIFGHRPHPQALDYAVDLGVALQLTNIMRDVREDAERGRIYLPLEELERFGYSEADLLASAFGGRDGSASGGGRHAGAFRDLMRFQAARARRYFERGRLLLPLLDRRSRMCVNVLQGVYSRILERIEELDYDVFQGRVSLSTGEKLALIARLWLQAIASRGARLPASPSSVRA
jgi:phytoene synthase